MELGTKQLGTLGKLCVPIAGLVLGLGYVDLPRALGPVLWGEDVEGGALYSLTRGVPLCSVCLF